MDLEVKSVSHRYGDLEVLRNLNLTIPEDDGNDRYVEPAFSISLGRSLTEELGMYVEYFGIYLGVVVLNGVVSCLLDFK